MSNQWTISCKNDFCQEPVIGSCFCSVWRIKQRTKTSAWTLKIAAWTGLTQCSPPEHCVIILRACYLFRLLLFLYGYPAGASAEERAEQPFCRNYSTLDFHTNTVSGCLATLIKKASKTVTKSISFQRSAMGSHLGKICVAPSSHF